MKWLCFLIYFFFLSIHLQATSAGSAAIQEWEDRSSSHFSLTFDEINRFETFIKEDCNGNKISETHHYYDQDDRMLKEEHFVLVEGVPQRIYTIKRDYDSAGHLISISEESEGKSKTTRYVYNSAGLLEKKLKPDGVILFYSYNEKGQLSKLESSNGSISYQYGYDQLNHLNYVHDLCYEKKQFLRYNDVHQCIEDQLDSKVKLSFEYNNLGHRSGITLPDNSRIKYHYSDCVSVERIKPNGTTHYLQSYFYDDTQHLVSCKFNGEMGEINYHYNELDSGTEITSPWWSQKIETKSTDPFENVTSVQTVDAHDESCCEFYYDAEGQLISEEGFHYCYDSLFNRISVNNQQWKVNGFNQLVLTPNASYEYDSNGNRIKKCEDGQVVYYAYDALDRLIKIEYPEKHAVTCVYDAFNRRIEKHLWVWQSDGSCWKHLSCDRFFYDQYQEMGKINEKGEIVELLILAPWQSAKCGAAVACELYGKVYLPVQDYRGSICCLIEPENGKSVETYHYTAFGLEKVFDKTGNIIDQSAIPLPWRFCSKRIDEETGLVYFGQRYYDPKIGCWISPDPLFLIDGPNLYAFAHNDPINYQDPYGFFSLRHIFDHFLNSVFNFFQRLQFSAHNAKIKLKNELRLPPPIGDALEEFGKTFFGAGTYLLMGPHFEETHVDCYGAHEISNKVRITFINGILNTRKMLLNALKTISECHGGSKIHYVFRPTEGWTWDITRSVLIKSAFGLGFRSMHAHLLAEMWRELIEEMGGVEGGGTIIHYAHSLGGSETDRARDLLSPEEQKMIRVITFGSATMVQNKGFQSVLNVVSINDGVSSPILEPIGHIRNYFKSDGSVRFEGVLFGSPFWPTDHLLNGPTYGPILRQFGEQFLVEFKNDQQKI